MLAANNLRQWEIENTLSFEDTPGGLVRCNIQTPRAAAQIYLQGAHVTHFQPAGSDPMLFLSGETLLAEGKPIRGGVPVIFPWFGPRQGHPESPAHGFARVLEWDVESTGVSPDGIATIVLRLDSTADTRAQWPHNFTLRHRITVGAELGMELEVTNRSSEPFSFEEALHTYFTVSDSRAATVAGLQGAEYIDKTDALKRKTESEPLIRITAETDRVYLSTQSACVLDDAGSRRRITVSKTGSDSTVVWNPWIAKSAALADFGDDEWQGMICIETANAADNAVTLPAGGTHSMTVRIECAQAPASA